MPRPDERAPASGAPQASSLGSQGTISVIIPAWNGRELTEACVESLRKGRERHGAPFELLLVDNGSEDDTAEWAEDYGQQHPWFRTIRLPKNLGFAGGVNAGLREARGRFVTILNNDTLAPVSLLPRLLAAWRRIPRAGLVAPVSNYVKGQQILEHVRGEDMQDVEAIAARLDEESHGRVQELGLLAGLCLFTEREFLNEIGALEEAYGIGNFEDDDLCLRVRKAGRSLLVARDAYLFHHGNRTFQALGVDYDKQLAEQEAIHRARWANDPLFEAELAVKEERWEAAAAHAARLPEDSRASSWAERCNAKTEESLGRPAAALPHWDAFVRAHPWHSEAQAHRALCLLAAGDESGGRQALADAFGSCYFDRLAAASALTGLARHDYEHGRPDEAIASIDDALALRPDFVPGLNLRAVLHIEREEYAEAEALLAPYSSRDDDALLANLGIACARQGRLEEAEALFLRGTELGGQDCPAAHNLASLHSALAAQR